MDWENNHILQETRTHQGKAFFVITENFCKYLIIFLNLASEFPYKSLNGIFEDYTIWAWAACGFLNMVGYCHFRVEKHFDQEFFFSSNE